MLRKIYMLIFSMLLIVSLTITPYSFNSGFANAKSIVLQVVGGNKNFVDVKELKDKIQKSRGEKIKGIEQVDILFEDSLNNKFDAVALPIEFIMEHQFENITNLINSGKIVYLYGDNLNLKKAEDVFGIKLVPNVDSSKVDQKNVGTKNRNVIGVVKNKETNEFELLEGNILVEEGSIQPFMYIDMLLDNLYLEHLKKDSIFKKNLSYAADTPVDSKRNVLTTKYVNSVKIATLNGDYYLYQDLSETDSDVDYFGLDSSMELIAYNGATNEFLDIKHSLPFDSDNINYWGPKSSNDSSFTVSFPFGVSYSWDTSSSVSVETTGSTTDDWADWYVGPRWYQNNLVSPALFRPGTAWTSTGTYAAIDIFTNGQVYYNYAPRDIFQDMNYRYDY
ncbi:MAG: hypothetical protein ACH0QD_10770 [Tepidibacillus sp.]